MVAHEPLATCEQLLVALRHLLVRLLPVLEDLATSNVRLSVPSTLCTQSLLITYNTLSKEIVIALDNSEEAFSCLGWYQWSVVVINGDGPIYLVFTSDFTVNLDLLSSLFRCRFDT